MLRFYSCISILWIFAAIKKIIYQSCLRQLVDNTISATIQQILTKFSAVVTYVK